jgi:transcription elongation factor GreA
VSLGSTVVVESLDGSETFSIVGSAEARPADGKISNESPVGRALLGRTAGDRITVRLPNGTDVTYTITKIS